MFVIAGAVATRSEHVDARVQQGGSGCVIRFASVSVDAARCARVDSTIGDEIGSADRVEIQVGHRGIREFWVTVVGDCGC